MADVDTSITANAGKNLMGNLGQIAQTMNAINQNRLFMGRVAAGQALQQSINPQTGQVDFQAFNRLIQQNPKIAPFAQEALTAALGQRGQDISNTTGQTNLTKVYTDLLRQDIAAAKDPLAAVLRGVAAGRYPQSFAVGFLGGAPLGDGSSLGSHMADLAKEAAIASGSETAMEAQFGKPGSVNVGGQNVAVTENRVTGERNTMGGNAGALDMTLTPEASAQRVPMIGSNNVPMSAPQSALVEPTGQPKPSALTGPSGEVRTGLAPGVAEAGNVAGQQNAQMAMALQGRAAKVRDNKAILGNMEGLLDNFTPGPQSGFWKSLNQLATQYGLVAPGSPPANKAAAQEEFGKLAFQLAQSQFQALGGTGTDAKLDSTMQTSPSELLTRYGNKGIIRLLKGNEDAVLAQEDAWTKWQRAGNGPESYGRFLNQWNKIYDPRAFQAPYMNPAERQTMLKGMTGAEQTQFEKSYKLAVKLGWVAP